MIPGSGPGRGVPWWRGTTPLFSWHQPGRQESIGIRREGRMVAVLESRHRRVYCSTCGGVGEVYDRTTGRLVTCPVCNGTGLPPKSMAKPSDPIRMCGKCGGTGRVRDPKTGDLIDCKVCHGSGAVR